MVASDSRLLDKVAMPEQRKTLAHVLLMLLWTAAAQAQTPVQVETVMLRAISEQVGVSGTVTSPQTATLSAAVAGQVAAISVDEGRDVSKGDTLLALDAELARLALERAQLETRQRETVLADARRRLSEAQSVGPERGIAQTQIDSLQAEVANVEASLAVLAVTEREQAAVLARHTVKAPFSGVIRSRLAELGEWVSPGVGLFELVAMDNLRFDFLVSQNLFGRIAPNTPVDIMLDARPGLSLRGKVDAIVPISSSDSRTFLVRVLAESSDTASAKSISPGMSASGRIRLDAAREGLAVTRDSVLRFSDGRLIVWVVETSDGVDTVRAQSVQGGLEFDEFIEITEGLEQGDRVVSRGNESLQDGQSVKPLNGAP